MVRCLWLVPTWATSDGRRQISLSHTFRVGPPPARRCVGCPGRSIASPAGTPPPHRRSPPLPAPHPAATPPPRPPSVAFRLPLPHCTVAALSGCGRSQQLFARPPSRHLPPPRPSSAPPHAAPWPLPLPPPPPCPAGRPPGGALPPPPSGRRAACRRPPAPPAVAARRCCAWPRRAPPPRRMLRYVYAFHNDRRGGGVE